MGDKLQRWGKRVLMWATLVIGITLVGFGSFFYAAMATPFRTVNAVAGNGGLIKVHDAYSFVPADMLDDDTVIGIFLTRPESAVAATYWGSVSAEDIYRSSGLTSFNPTYTAMVKHNDVWTEVPRNDQGQCVGPFRIDSTHNIEQSDKLSINWYLDAAAAAAVYGIKCAYQDPVTPEIHESIYYVVYTDVWTYLTAEDGNGANYVTNFLGGRNRTLTVQVAFNDGATTSTWEAVNDEIDANGVRYGPIRNNEIISLDTLVFSLQTVNGEAYTGNISVQRIPDTNRVTLVFEDNLAKDTYILQVASAVDGKVYGRLVINNAGRSAGINLSHIWVFLAVFGGFLVLVAAIIFFLPLIVAKINANKVYKENNRIARMKNPEAYANKSGNVFQRLQTKLQKFANRKKGGAAVVAEEDKPKEEAAPVYKPKFTDMLRERRENRDFVHKSGQAEASATKQPDTVADSKASFAFLRDDDDEIASLQEEKEDISTIETGAYVEDGVTFAKLDSLQDETKKDEHGENGENEQ